MSQMPQNTVFVVGAGASEEAKLPTSHDLKSKISSLLDIRFDSLGYKLESGDHKIVAALNLHVQQPDGCKGDINPYLKEAWHISDALPQAISIDNFIDTHRDNDKIALCGKLAIVRSILDAEKNSLLHFERQRVDSTIDFDALADTWYTRFFQLLTENCSKYDLKARLESITLIIFNYDRCIEHFLYFALQNYYKITGPEAAKIIMNIKIYHPYGRVGTLPWINPNGAVEFGSEPNSVLLLDLTKQIRTFAEGTNPDSSEILKIHEHMKMANRLVFLGFAFHKLNMQLIAPKHDDEGDELINKMCFATTLGVSNSDKEVINAQIYEQCSVGARVDVQVKMENLQCGAFFSHFWRSLSF